MKDGCNDHLIVKQKGHAPINNSGGRGWVATQTRWVSGVRECQRSSDRAGGGHGKWYDMRSMRGMRSIDSLTHPSVCPGVAMAVMERRPKCIRSPSTSCLSASAPLSALIADSISGSSSLSCPVPVMWSACR